MARVQARPKSPASGGAAGERPFLVAIEPGDARRAWGVRVPDLPGCTSAGDTLDEAIANARRAIATHLGILRAQGRSPVVRGATRERVAEMEEAGLVWALVAV